MATIALSLSSRVDATEKSQVLVRLTITRANRPRFKSGVYVRPEWMRDGVLTIPKRGRLNFLEIKEAEEAKAKLDDFVIRLTHISNQLGEEATKESIEEVMEATMSLPTAQITSASIMAAQKSAKNHKELPRSFYELMEYYLSEKRLSYERGFRVVMRMMARYEQFVRETDNQRKDFAWDIKKCTREDIEDFFDYARHEKDLSEEYPTLFANLKYNYPLELSTKHPNKTYEERGENTIISMTKRLRAFFRWVVERGYTTNNPFSGLKMKSETYGSPWYLTMEERNKIADADLTALWEAMPEEERPKGRMPLKTLTEQRDVFVFQCLVGCRVGDLLHMTKSSVIDGAVEYIAEKTEGKRATVVRVPLNGRAQAIVNRYKKRKGTKLLPFISSQRYNDCIKTILTLCGITRMVTVRNSITGAQEQKPLNEIASSHMARRTFIGNLYKQVKDPNLIGKLSGHSEGSKAFTRYRDIDEDLMKETVSLID